jgi:hypothetical protein
MGYTKEEILEIERREKKTRERGDQILSEIRKICNEDTTRLVATPKEIFARQQYAISWKQVLKLINENSDCLKYLSYSGFSQGRNSCRILTPQQIKIIKAFMG